MSDQRYEDIIVQAVLDEYDYVKNKSYIDRDFYLESIRRTINNICIENLSRSSRGGPKSVAGRGAAMRAAGRRPSSDECCNCEEIGHRCNNCRKLQRRRRSQLHKQKANKGKKKGGEGKRCSYHQCRSHDDSGCLKQKERRQQARAINVANVSSAHLSGQTAKSGTSTSGFSFAAARIWPMTEENKTSTITLGPSVEQLREQRAADTLGLLGAFTELPADNPLRGRAYVAPSPVIDTHTSDSVLEMLVNSGSTGRVS